MNKKELEDFLDGYFCMARDCFVAAYKEKSDKCILVDFRKLFENFTHLADWIYDSCFFCRDELEGYIDEYFKDFYKDCLSESSFLSRMNTFLIDVNLHIKFVSDVGGFSKVAILEFEENPVITERRKEKEKIPVVHF